MFLSRLESVLGYVPGLNRTTPAAKRHREESGFFCTSGYTASHKQARKKEVSRLFARMRSELLDLAHDFADEAGEIPAVDPQIRQGVFVEMMVASEFVADELESEIAALCLSGEEAERNGNSESLQEICRTAGLLSRLQARMREFQQELDSMLEITLSSFQRYSFFASLNFDPVSQPPEGAESFVEQFLVSIDEAISTLSQFTSVALAERDFETASQLCLCNLQLSKFLADANRIIAEV
jgi:hypothetical protein